MNRRELINNLRKKQNEGKRMKKTIPTIFITDDSKENTSLMVKRNVNTKNKKGGRFFVKVIKKNQIIMFVSALCLVGVGYLAYNPMEETNFVSTTLDNSALADIGDARLVSSNDVTSENENTSDNMLNNTNTVNNTSNTTNANDVINTNTAEQTQETNAITADDEYFVKSKLERDTMYSQMIETYEKVLNSANSLETQKQSATQEITKINETKNSIMICENLIQTKGFTNNIVFVNGESISVIIGVKELKTEEIAQAVMKNLERGATLLTSVGAYTKRQGYTLLLAVRRHEVYKTYEIIYQIDPHAFIVVGDAGNITGEGFLRHPADW